MWGRTNHLNVAPYLFLQFLGRCFAVRGKGKGKSCLFPFLHENKTYDKCMSKVDWNTEHDIFVCATRRSNHNNELTESGICALSCDREGRCP